MRSNVSNINDKSNIPKTIDIEDVIRSKSPKLLSVLPRFALRYLKRILHEEEINAAIFRNKNKYGIAFVNAILDEFQLNIDVVGEENIPKTGRKIVAANHPIGGIEGLALMSVIGNYRKDLKFIVNDILANLENMRELFVPVNKLGANTREAIKTIEDNYESEVLILTFPFGLVSRKRGGKIG